MVGRKQEVKKVCHGRQNILSISADIKTGLQSARKSQTAGLRPSTNPLVFSESRGFVDGLRFNNEVQEDQVPICDHSICNQFRLWLRQPFNRISDRFKVFIIYVHEVNYPGIHFIIEASLDKMKRAIKVDISTGDIIPQALSSTPIN